MQFLTLDYHRITPSLYVGTYPQTPEDVLHLKGVGVTAVLSVQSDLDLDERGVDWPRFWKFYTSHGIAATRVPITDFDSGSLRRRLEDAVGALEGFVASGKVVYLHCTAGVNRSTTVAAAWLMRQQRLTRADAVDQISNARPVAAPDLHALDLWAKDASSR